MPVKLVKGPIYGYKATDENMRCRGFQYELGKWYKHTGKLELCESGFHFCEFQSGPWCYYDQGRLFRVEAMDVVLSIGPGADLKHVCKKIRLIEEIKIDSDHNTGYHNTGDRNTGDGNTGDGNCCNNHSGSLCMVDPPFYLFDLPADRSKANFDLIYQLSGYLMEDEKFDYAPFLAIENATNDRIKKLHNAHKAARAERKL